MKYKIVSHFASNWAERFNFNWNFYFNGNELSYFFLSKFDYSILFEFKEGMFNSCFYKDVIYFSNSFSNKYFILELSFFKLLAVEKNETFLYKFDNYSVTKNDDTIYYKSALNGKTTKYYFNNTNHSRFLQSGILEYFIDTKTDNWLRLIDPATGLEKWRVDYPYQIDQIAEYDDVIVFIYKEYTKVRTDRGYEGVVDMHNPSLKVVKALDANTGKELWSHEGAIYKIDKERNTILTSLNVLSQEEIRNDIIYRKSEYDNITGLALPIIFEYDYYMYEIDIRTGNIITKVVVCPKSQFHYEPHFADDEGIYYTVWYYGSFGKIRKSDGKIEWEFDLVDDKGSKRKVLAWLKLGNGKFVLQTPPNHKNGDFTCIFDSAENMEYASVVNGVRVKPVLE